MSTIPGTEGFTNGPYEIPDPKEAGNSVFDKLEEFMDRMATHTHSGADSNSITLNISKGVQELVNTIDFVWDLVSADKYRASVPTAVGANFDDNVRTYYYRDGAEPKEFHPTIEKIDNSNYYIYSNDNTIDLKVVTI